MVEMETEKERPNIRIQIQNEKMEVDVSEDEDGEIVEDEQMQVQPNSRAVFTTGINIFDQEEQKKLQERARRFSLKPEETYSFTDADLEKLRESLGITNENEHLARLDTVHLLGTIDMQIEDILEYFSKYAPLEIEFIDQTSVNVKWHDNITAARAMFYTSKPVKDMPVREQVLVKDFLEIDQPEEKEGQSILLKSRQVEFQVEEIIKAPKKVFENAVDLEQITIPIPPGYWRLGDKHPKAKCLLLRYALKTDKKPFKTENLAKYYKKLGNAKIQVEKKKGGIFERNKDLPRGKNPWGNLARNWDQDAKFRETIPTSGETVEVKNPSLATRLGMKLKVASESENELEPVEEKISLKKPKGRSMRMRMYADEEEERIKMKKAIQKLKRSSEKLQEPKDLRTILSLNNNLTEPTEIIDLEDLGSKLKNRSRQMVFSIESDHHKEREKKENIKTDIRTILNKRRAKSPRYERLIEAGSYRHRDRSPLRRHSSPARHRSLHSRHTPERSVRYGHFSRYGHHSGQSKDDVNGTKPKSKVTVVIKKQKKPTVASTIWSKVQESESEDSSSESDSSKSGSSSSSDSSEESGSESDSSEASGRESRQIQRPGFDRYNSRLDPRSHLKVTMANDRYSRR